MTNKEKIRKSLDKDLNKENNYKIIRQKIVEGEKMNNKNLWKWSLIPICLAVIPLSVVFLNTKESSNVLTNHPYVDKEKNIDLYINDINKMGAMRLDADVKEISSNGVNDLWPEFLKGGINIPKDLDKARGSAIYTRTSVEGPYDHLNCYVYSYFTKDYERDIRVAFSDTGKPIRDYYFSEEGSKTSKINGINLTIYKYETIYFAEFQYKGYSFDIETTGITEEELANLLVSIIK